VARISMLLSFWVAFGAASAAAQSEEVPVIEAGREAEVLDLFSPYTLTGDVSDGYRLMNVRVEPTHIVCELVGPDGATASVRLDHPDHAEGPDGETASFAVRREATTDAGRSATDAIFFAVRDNDEGHFYRRHARPPTPTLERAVERLGSIGAWIRDGTLMCLVGFLFFVVLLVRELGRGSGVVAFALVAVTLLGAILRLLISPETMLGAWPFSRTTSLMRLVWEGPGLSGLLEATGAEVPFFDLVTSVNLIFAIFTPPAVYLHAKKLLEDERAAAVAAAVVALLPIHLRFSHSEVAFIASLALSSFTFALVHTALKDESARYRIAALVVLPLVAGLMFITRPLNQIFLPLLLWTALYLARRAPLSRRVFVASLLTAVGVLSFVFEIQPLYESQIVEGASLSTLWDGVWSFFLPKHNTLLHPWITPPGLLALVLAGAWWSTRTAGRLREQGTFLAAWLLLFYVAHAYVLPQSLAMQARYHLHLVVPFAMLAALAASRLYVRRRALFWIGAAYVAASPLIHADFIRDVAFDDQNEYAFVRSAAEAVEPACTVLEYTGEGPFDVDVRFDRAGALLDGRVERRLFASIAIGPAPGSTSPLSERALEILESPPPCLYYYEGLFCYGRKERDEPLARACAAMHRVARLRELQAQRFTHRVYDGNLAVGMEDDRREPITLTLYRVVE